MRMSSGSLGTTKLGAFDEDVDDTTPNSETKHDASKSLKVEQTDA